MIAFTFLLQNFGKVAVTHEYFVCEYRSVGVLGKLIDGGDT